MAFAFRADLLARSSASRLAQLTVPTDVGMVPVEALRVAITGGDLAGYGADDQTALTLALAAIDQALADADALILSYGIPATAQTPVLARLACTIALYYLQGAERMTEDARKVYDGVITTLKAHARGDLNLVPAGPTDPAPEGDVAMIESQPRRYRAAWPNED